MSNYMMDHEYRASVFMKFLIDLTDHCETVWFRNRLEVGERLTFIVVDNADIKVYLSVFTSDEEHLCTVSLADPDAIAKLKALIEKYYVPRKFERIE